MVKEIEKKGFPSEKISDITGIALEHLKDKNERIAWSDCLKITAFMGEIFTDEEIEELGERWTKSPLVNPFKIIMRSFLTPQEMYRLVSRPRRGFGPQIFTCIYPVHRDIGENGVEMKLTMQRGYEFCRELFLMFKGGFTTIPGYLGLPPAVVNLTWIEGGARYEINAPSGGGVSRRASQGVDQTFHSLESGR
jgi:hypothetical protein